MNCEVAHERIVLAAYGELADEQIHELDRHLTTCADCRDRAGAVAGAEDAGCRASGRRAAGQPGGALADAA